MAYKYEVEINGVDISSMVERDSYSTALEPVFSDAVTTMDGVEHLALLRWRGVLTIGINPQNAENTAILASALLTVPAMVKYHCLQRNATVYAQMRPDTLSADFLSRCLYRGEKWNGIETITLTEL